MLEIFEESIRSFVLKKVPNHKVETQNQLHPLVRVWGSGLLFVIDSRSSPRSERIAEDADDLPAKKETFVFFLPLSFWGQLLPIQAFYIEGFSTEKNMSTVSRTELFDARYKNLESSLGFSS